MRVVTKQTRELIVKVNELWGPWSYQPALQEAVSAIRQIAESGELAAIPLLLGIIFRRRPMIPEAAADALENCVERFTPMELAELDWLVRLPTPMSQWHQEALPLLREGMVAAAWGRVNVLGLVSFNRDGFVREAAVAALASSRSGNEVPFLIIRLNDWVAPVRELARAALVARIRPEFAGAFMRALSLVYRLVEQGRDAHREIFERILNLLRSEPCRNALWEGIASSDRRTRRLTSKVLRGIAEQSQLPLLEDALAVDDTVIRIWAAHELRSNISGENLPRVLEKMWQDRFVPVRREALCGFVERMPEVAETKLREALADGHTAIRETARFYLRGMGETDFATFYRNQLKEAGGNRLAVMIAGMGETGVAADAKLVAEFLNHREARVRRAAVVAVGRLDAENFLEALLEALQDERANVGKAAREVLLRHLPFVAPEQLWSIFEGTEWPHVRSLVLSLMAEMRWWHRTPLLVRAMDSDDEQIVVKATKYLQRNRNANVLVARPTREEVQGLENLLEKRRKDGKEPVLRELEEMVAYVRREMFPPRWR